MAQPAAGWNSFKRPFAATSLWNSRPVDPVLGDDVIPKSKYTPYVGENEWSVPVFLGKAGDPPMSVFGPSGTGGVYDADAEQTRAVTIRHWPADVEGARATDGHAEIVDPEAGVVHSFWQLRKSGGKWTASLYGWSPLDGTGWGDPSHYYHGARAAGVPSIAGLIRKHEVGDGDSMYRHALAASLTFDGLANDPVYIFPATAADIDAAVSNTGRIPEGALLMLPADFDAQALSTPELRKVGETLKVYGAYVVDRNVGTPYFIYAEIGSGLKLHKGGWNNATAADLERIRLGLRRVVSAREWIDGDGKPFKPERNLNLLSMRGPWRVESGDAAGSFETWRQAVVFKPTAIRTVQVNDSGRSTHTIAWAVPTAGTTCRLSAATTGGGKLRIVLRAKNGDRIFFDSGELADGQSVTFAWPSDSSFVTYAISGIGQSSSVSGRLVVVK